MIIQKFISRRFLFTMLWILLAVFVIVRDGDFVKEVVAIVCVGCVALLSCIFVIGTTFERLNLERPQSVAEADYATRAGISNLCRTIVDIERANQEAEKHLRAALDVSRRAGNDVQNIIAKMEALDAWVRFSVGYIAHFEEQTQTLKADADSLPR